MTQQDAQFESVLALADIQPGEVYAATRRRSVYLDGHLATCPRKGHEGPLKAFTLRENSSGGDAVPSYYEYLSVHLCYAVVAGGLYLVHQFPSRGLDDAAVLENVDDIGNYIVQKPLVMGDHY